MIEPVCLCAVVFRVHKVTPVIVSVRQIASPNGPKADIEADFKVNESVLNNHIKRLNKRKKL